ncbi:MAG: hypothetical protein AB7O88_15300 [Reyranellaceae bacterium]
MKFIVFGLAGLAVICWLVALVSIVRMFGMLSGRLKPSAMMFRGIEWFNAANFKPEAAAARKTFVRAFVAFFICILAIMVVVMLATRPT